MTRPAGIPYRHWLLQPPISDKIRKELGHLNPVLLQVLYNRGLTHPGQIQAFLERRYLEAVDPFLLPDMEVAVARIEQALQREETVIVYGDFDADGVTSTVLLVEVLRGLGFSRQQAQPYIPARVDEGYGLNIEALQKLKEKGADLVITVDCGIRSVHEVAYANEIGLDMIVTDHHSLGSSLPEALAVINPKREGCTYPETMLAGVGIAYKLAQALRQALPKKARYEDEQLLDLVAIGTVADIAPLQRENRKLVIEGLNVMNQRPRPGIAALAEVARIAPGMITSEGIGFGLGPRINAAGRLESAYLAARLLAANNMIDARELANQLNLLNARRQQLTRSLSEHAETMLPEDAPILIVADSQFLSGLVGLVASRLAEKYYRPAIIIEHGPEESRGSCRSIPEFHITKALDQVEDILVRHGGHRQAAGFTLKNEHLEEFQERMTAIASEQLDGKELAPKLDIDAELELSDVDWALCENLDQLQPTGEKNATPVFMSRRLQVLNYKPVGNDGFHLKLQVSDGLTGMEAIAFRQGAWASCMPRFVDLAYTIGINEYQGRRSLQLKVEDIRAAE